MSTRDRQGPLQRGAPAPPPEGAPRTDHWAAMTTSDLPIVPRLRVEDLCDVVQARVGAERCAWRPRRRPIEGIAVHRLGESLAQWSITPGTMDLVDVVDAFAGLDELRLAFPRGAVYDLIVTADGRVQQWVPLDCYGAHARDWSRRTVGVACLGDFTRHAPTAPQWAALVQLCTALRGGLAGLGAAAEVPWVRAHDQLPDGSADPSKRCPGDLLDMAALDHVSAPRLSYDLAAFGLRVSSSAAPLVA